MASYTDVPSFSSTRSPFKESGTGLALYITHPDQPPHHGLTCPSRCSCSVLTVSLSLVSCSWLALRSCCSLVAAWPKSLDNFFSFSKRSYYRQQTYYYYITDYYNITIWILIFKAWSVWRVACVELYFISVWIMELIQSWKFQHQQPIKYWHLFSSAN